MTKGLEIARAWRNEDGTDSRLAEMINEAIDRAYGRNRALEKALCVAREHDPSCPVRPTGPYDPLVHVEGCDCGAAKTNARIDAALDTKCID